MSPKSMSHKPIPPDIDFDDLPDDLCQLGLDLTRQAESLASAYPARTQGIDAERFQQKPNRLAGFGKLMPLVSVGIALTGLIAVIASGFPELPATEASGDTQLALDRPSADDLGKTDLRTAESPIAGDQASDPMPTRLFPVGIGLPVDGTTPASPPDFTSPEWEAILDLTPAEDWEGIELSL